MPARPQRVSQDRELGAAQNFAVLVQQHTQPVRRAGVLSGESTPMSPGQTRRNAFPFRYFENVPPGNVRHRQSLPPPAIVPVVCPRGSASQVFCPFFRHSLTRLQAQVENRRIVA
jgi:hypothetical protein